VVNRWRRGRGIYGDTGGKTTMENKNCMVEACMEKRLVMLTTFKIPNQNILQHKTD